MQDRTYEGRVELLADRFVVHADGGAVDAATGAAVRLAVTEGAAPTAVERDRVVERIASGEAAAGRRVVDAGSLSATRAFEASVAGEDAWAGRAALFERVSSAALEVLGLEQARRPGLWALPVNGARERRAAREAVARVARTYGVVPVCRAAAAACPALAALVEQRSVVLLALSEEECADAEARAAAAAFASSLRARLVVLVIGRAASDWDGPSLIAPRGWRGVAVASAPPVTGPVALRVAEAAAAYGAPACPAPVAGRTFERGDARDDPRAGPGGVRQAAGALVLARVDHLVAAGRAAEAERQLRVAHAAARRRGEAPARQAGYARALARVLTGTGRARAAARLLQEARDGLVAADDHHSLLEVNVELGHALVESTDFEEAAVLLHTTWLASRQLDERGHPRAALALARARWWSGDHQGVEEALGRVGPSDTLVVAEQAEWSWRTARLRRAQQRVAEAGQALSPAIALDAEVGHATLADLHVEAMMLQTVLGDHGRAREHYRRAMGATRRGLPLLRARVRVAWCEGLAMAGHRTRERERLAGALAAKPARLSPLLTHRVRQARGTAGRERRHGPLVCSTPPPAGASAVAGFVDELLEVLHICHAEDDARALARLCSLLRERLDASAVCVYGGDADVKLAWTGGTRSPSPDLARRAIATGALLPASVVNDGLEAAVAVRYGGVPIAALSCRWPPDRVVDDGRAGALLSTVAAACAPSVRLALDRRVLASAASADDTGLVGVSRAMAAVRAAAAAAAHAPFPVLIEGESGCGKELIARAVHRLGARRHRKFCAINCAAMSDELLEAELFGHTRGAFTGAVAERVGLFEEADGGTLLLDEVGELSPRAQAKLLRVLQEGELRRVGENIPRRVDVRILAASNRCLAGETARGRFRDDLRYRLDVIHIDVPPLRARREDIPLLAASFWKELASKTGSRAVLDPATVDALSRYDWPGNVRELQNVLAALAAQAPRRGRLTPGSLPARLGAAGTPDHQVLVTLDAARREFDARFIRGALAQAGGRRREAARALGLTRQGLAKIMARLGIEEAGAPDPPP
jgi:two-component system, NtrC family, response regulator AtoC